MVNDRIIREGDQIDIFKSITEGGSLFEQENLCKNKIGYLFISYFDDDMSEWLWEMDAKVLFGQTSGENS